MIDADRHIVLTGFMGVGKSAVARAVAAKLGREVADMDEIIAARAGKAITAIFAEEGEQGFRRRERTLAAELAQRRGLVIATGGGALLDADNREALGRSGWLVCLHCPENELLARLEGDDTRPLLPGPDRAARLRALWEARRPHYAEVPYHIAAGGLDVEETAARVISLLAGAPSVHTVATPVGSYPVYVAPQGLEHVGTLLAVRGVSANVVVVSDEQVWPLHGAALLEGLRRAGLAPTVITLPPGEAHKTLDTVRGLYARFVGAGLDRGGAVVALGGGVITDMVGFAAATYMRGVPLVLLPTSLLGMVDAAVGGKVAVDLPEGKNLVGAFVRPLLVLADPQVLQTLPEDERRAGLAEVIKAGVIGDAELFARLERGVVTPEALRWAMERALALKIRYVERDPYEQGERAHLNLGHTYAHAFESLSGYRLHHGLAVSAGMVAAAHLAEMLGLCSEATRRRLTACLQAHGLPTAYAAHPPQAVVEAMRSDKKRRGGRLRLVLPLEIGRVTVTDEAPPEAVCASLERIRA